MPEIHLRGKRGNGFSAIVNVDDFEKLNHLAWYLDQDGYARIIPKKEDRGKGSTAMHRIILDAPKGLIVDHINGNRLDNRKENLRLITTRENPFNMYKKFSSFCKYKGVCFMKHASHKKKPYRAQISYEKKKYYLGFYETEEEAAMVYNEYAYVYFGEFAKLNKVIL